MDFIFNIGREGEGEREMRMPSPAWILRIFASWLVRAYFLSETKWNGWLWWWAVSLER